MLYDAGCKKLTFVGGEPLLCPSLPKLLTESKSVGLTTMIVTNGSLLSHRFIQNNQQNIDWISLSIDSQYEATQFLLGRGFSDHVAQTLRNVQLIRNAGIRLKMNTVVTKYTKDENMGQFIERLKPERWKVFQMLPVSGQNDQFVGELTISQEDFNIFVSNRSHIRNAVFEDNEAMRGSYAMLSPDGRFFSNTSGKHAYSESIFQGRIEETLDQDFWDTDKFQARGGIYSWASISTNPIQSSQQEIGLNMDIM